VRVNGKHRKQSNNYTFPTAIQKASENNTPSVQKHYRKNMIHLENIQHMIQAH
jgi:hypothetical protein